jgi:nucleoside-diphosphate-sugar epimerase
VLVSGAAGFQPAYKIETLLYRNETRAAGIQVTGLVRDVARAGARFSAHAGRRDLRLQAQDLGEPLAPGLDADVIVHAASPASPKDYSADPAGVLKPNVLGTLNLLELARASKAGHFLYFSSGEVYGQPAEPEQPVAEDARGWVDPAALRSCYAEGKRAGEALCVAWQHQHGVPARIVRPFHTYGPGMRLDDGRVFADFVADIVQGRDIRLMSDGSARRSFCYLADATLGFFTVLLKGQPGQAYNIGNPAAETSIAELAERLVGLYPEKGLKVVRQQRAASDAYMPSRIARSCPDTAKAEALGWKALTGLDEGFKRSIGSYT